MMWSAKGSNGRKVVARRRKEMRVEGQLFQRATIDIDALPDEVLLEVFSFYLDRDHQFDEWPLDTWHKLVHVCQRWRQVVFASPRRLNLQLFCTIRTPVKKLLDIWPDLPIVIEDYGGLRDNTNIDAALEHNERVCKVTIYSPSPVLKKIASIKKPFPALTSLELRSYDRRVPILPDSFLGGSAPRLRTLSMNGIPFPGLPKLLLSAHHLVDLHLLDIPDSGFMSPEAIVTCLSSLTILELLELGFRSPLSPPHQANRHLPTVLLPSLTSFSFVGVSEFLEDILARIDVPLLKKITITFFNQPVFHTPLLRSFISRSEAFKAFHRAEIIIAYFYFEVNLLRERVDYHGELLVRLRIACQPSDRGLSSIMRRVYNSSLPPLPTLEHLNICANLRGLHSHFDMEAAEWLELLHPFITVKCLYLDAIFAPRVARALQELAEERVAEVLPALQNVFVQGPVQRVITQFIAARQLLGHSVTVHNWDRK